MDDHHFERPPYRTAPSGDTLGLRHVREALRDLPFPTTTAEIRRRAGHWRMPTTGAEFHPLAEYLQDVPEATFRDVHDLTRAVARAHPELRE